MYEAETQVENEQNIERLETFINKFLGIFWAEKVTDEKLKQRMKAKDKLNETVIRLYNCRKKYYIEDVVNWMKCRKREWNENVELMNGRDQPTLVKIDDQQGSGLQDDFSRDRFKIGSPQPWNKKIRETRNNSNSIEEKEEENGKIGKPKRTWRQSLMRELSR